MKILLLCIAIIVLFILYSSHRDGFQSSSPFGFYIIRHMNNEQTMEYWWTAYTYIRKYHTNHIIVIDDNSRPEFVMNPKNKYRESKTTNCTFESYPEYPGRGELLPYYAFHKNHPFETAVIVHDSTFINRKIEIPTNTVRFLWHFDTHQFDNPQNEMTIIQTLKNSSIVQQSYDNKENWNGCFGVQSIISWNFLHMLQEKYNLFHALDVVKTRDMRMAAERIFAVLCYIEEPRLRETPSYYGCIFKMKHHYSYTFKQFQEDSKKATFDSEYPVVKVWSGR